MFVKRAGGLDEHKTKRRNKGFFFLRVFALRRRRGVWGKGVAAAREYIFFFLYFFGLLFCSLYFDGRAGTATGYFFFLAPTMFLFLEILFMMFIMLFVFCSWLNIFFFLCRASAKNI